MKLTKTNLIKIQEIDKIFYKEDTLTLDWYLERYNEKNKGIFLIDRGIIVGYLVFVPINYRLYEAIINGVLINDYYINPNMFVKKSDYNYVNSCVILEEYRGKGYGTLMMKKMLEEVKGKICTLTVTKQGYYLAKKVFNLKMKINDSVSVFEQENY